MKTLTDDIEKAPRNGMILIQSPPATGKTSFASIYAQYCKNTMWQCMLMSGLFGYFLNQYIRLSLVQFDPPPMDLAPLSKKKKEQGS